MSRKIPRKLLNDPKLPWSPFPRKTDFDKPIIKGKPRARPDVIPFEENPWKKGKFPKHALKIKLYEPRTIREITPIENWPILKGDLVEVLVGPDTGKHGIIRAIGKHRNQVKVEGLNLRAVKTDGQIMMVEDPLHYSEVKLVDPATGEATDIEIRYTDEGEEVRVCVQSERIIMKPEEIKDDKDSIVEGPMDTKEEVALSQTYIPSMLLFHEEIMKEMNIPMSIPKRGPERRDLIMQEIEEDVITQREIERKQDEEEMANAQVSATPLLDKIKERIPLPWSRNS